AIGLSAYSTPLSGLPTRLSREGLDVLHESRAIKIDGPEAVRHNRPLAIDHVGGRYTTHPKFPGDIHTYVHPGREGVAAFGHEGLDCFPATTIDRDGQYHHVLVPKSLVYPLHGGHLALADSSPGRPEAHHHDLALQICRMEGLAIGVWKFERGHRGRLAWLRQTFR